MDDEYYRLTSELDAREILRYLNNLGIHNISGEVLKYFITGRNGFYYHARLLTYNYKLVVDKLSIYICRSKKAY